MNIKRILSFFLLLFILSVLCSCDNALNTKQDEKVVKIVLNVKDEMKNLINEQISNIQVNDRGKKLQIELVGNDDDSDIFVFETKDFEKVKKILEPIEKNTVDIKTRNTFSSYEAVLKNEKLLAYPFATKINLVFYDEMFFNTDEVSSMEKMMFKDIGEGRINLAFDICDVSVSSSFLATNGFNVFEKDYDKSSAASSMDYLIRLYSSTHFSALSVDKALEEFEKRNLGAIIASSDNYSVIKSVLKDNFSVASLPRICFDAEDIQLRSFSTYLYFGINKKSKNKSLAMDLCDYLSNEETQLKLLDINYIPCNRHLLEDKAPKNRLLNISSNQALNASQLPEIAFEEKFREKYSSFSKDILSGVITKSNMMKMLENFVKNVMQ